MYTDFIGSPGRTRTADKVVNSQHPKTAQTTTYTGQNFTALSHQKRVNTEGKCLIGLDPLTTHGTRPLEALAQSIQTRRMRERGEIAPHHTSTKMKKSKLEEAETTGNPDEPFDDKIFFNRCKRMRSF